MSTLFGIFKNQPRVDEGGCLVGRAHNEGEDYVICAFRSREIQWINGFNIISKYLKDDIKVYPLDNTPQGIYTIGDIKNEMIIKDT